MLISPSANKEKVYIYIYIYIFIDSTDEDAEMFRSVPSGKQSGNKLRLY